MKGQQNIKRVRIWQVLFVILQIAPSSCTVARQYSLLKVSSQKSGPKDHILSHTLSLSFSSLSLGGAQRENQEEGIGRWIRSQLRWAWLELKVALRPSVLSLPLLLLLPPVPVAAVTTLLLQVLSLSLSLSIDIYIYLHTHTYTYHIYMFIWVYKIKLYNRSRSIILFLCSKS